MRPLPIPDDEVLLGVTHELIALWARLPEDKKKLILKYAWTLLPDRHHKEVRSIVGYGHNEQRRKRGGI